jgi:hypothetical protein
MDPQLKWLLQLGVAAFGLVSLFRTGRQNGWL